MPKRHNPDEPPEPKPIGDEGQTSTPSGYSYYYDDGFGYESYLPDDDEDEKEYRPAGKPSCPTDES